VLFDAGGAFFEERSVCVHCAVLC